jgi:hypothetical protein
MTALDDSGRSSVIAALQAELFGPAPNEELRQAGTPLSIDPPPAFASFKDAAGPFHEQETGQEILNRDRPTKRYGVGVLYPQEQIRTDANEGVVEPADPSSELDPERPEQAAEIPDVSAYATEDDDFDLSATSEFRPSAMAVSFLAEIGPDDSIEVHVTGGRYELVRANIDGRDRDWFVRRPVEHTITFPAPTGPGRLSPLETPVTEPLQLRAELLARRHETGWLLTAALLNIAPGSRSADTASLFQAAFTVCVIRAGQPNQSIVPYPDPRSARLLDRDPEARSLDLMYRNAPTFGVGHGCAATWDAPWGMMRCQAIKATALPAFETPSITPDVTLPDGSALSVPMGPLAGYDQNDDGFASIRQVSDAYAAWIDELTDEANQLSGHRRQAADDHLLKCRRAHARIVEGLDWLATDQVARRAFMLANRAILEQQLNFRSDVRETRITKDGVTVAPAKPVKDWQAADRRWRAFQIGFLVATARSAALGDDGDRDTVELIFFPTGGGKTEAYLGLAAFCLFHQRLTGRNTGTSVLMRYTLRLLTSQQFLRASALVCAMEIIRAQNEDLGEQQFTIGIWVGGTTTPNTRAAANTLYSSLARGYGDNPFLVLRCPWCATQMGPVEAEKDVPKAEPKLAGYRKVGGTIAFRCPDRTCEFRRGLPVFVIDDDVYDARPSIVIGTVDKFAMLAFLPRARRLFGLDTAGNREVDPPNLIIQDELHLISGPLGSMVGMYEPIIERLCTTDGMPPIRPKIVGSTATIRNYADQICGLYGRKDAALFPPHGLDASDSFFAKHATDPGTGGLAQGRIYVGVHAPGLGSIQTAQVRAGASLLQSVLDLPEYQQDPWWTSMMFFNSLRELGTSVSLLQSDIPDYLWAAKLRDDHPQVRFINSMMELTSRKRQDEIPKAIGDLERASSSGRAVDVCLASNIIEVGVDIPRLSLLTVLGQPKSTSQYIQITGRVGRNWQERPGLVVTIYSASRPRDRSHYEKFQAYHQRLYAEVEPVSVTPFSAPVLRRAAHAAVIAHARQNGPSNLQPSPLPSELFDEAEQVLIERAAIADPESVNDLKRELENADATNGSDGNQLSGKPAQGRTTAR